MKSGCATMPVSSLAGLRHKVFRILPLWKELPRSISLVEKAMQLTRGYQTELDLNNEQITACKKHAGAARWAYNWGLKRRQEVYSREHRSICSMELHRELNV